MELFLVKLFAVWIFGTSVFIFSISLFDTNFDRNFDLMVFAFIGFQWGLIKAGVIIENGMLETALNEP